jgi:hypothetical protein
VRVGAKKSLQKIDNEIDILGNPRFGRAAVGASRWFYGVDRDF